MATDLSARQHPRLNRLYGLSCVMKWVSTLCAAIMVVVALGLALALIDPSLDFLATETAVYLDEQERPYADIPFVQRMGILCLMLVYFGILIAMAWNLRRLFSQFQELRFFELATLNRILLAGSCLIAFGVFDIVEDPISSILATLDYPEGQRQLIVGLDGSELFFLVFGGLILVFGWIMREAAAIDEENRQFV
ncbi:conserved hypothetical protein [Roseibium sp. TrichSKD4]|uniref:DUF2975 domain-containing protein n=1 Tax=Roseibium sp. TrichSKD4 TaxID=744980 RepID=UPI0001E571CE|nr:DUF2975 domain-containing protein [Roseibium sp. TrichSKD4]EFO29015.1 conserved hypothetical protein [Roseibium sp. TrichSKD4]